MKQRLSVEDIKELSPEQQEKLREWWEPRLGDCYIDNMNHNDMTYSVGFEYLDKRVLAHRCIPLLSIGQCLALLETKIGRIETGFGQPRRWYVDMINGEKFEDDDLTNSLWQAVKSIL